ncbi:MAG: hypothetical protein AB2A00_32535 [Myxococcota bacterium]
MTGTQQPWEYLAPNIKVMETIQVVFASSEVLPLIGSSTLRDVLIRQMDALMTGRDVHLHVVWDALKLRPGFVPEKAYAPFCTLEKLGGLLGVQFQLPNAVSALDEATRARHARDCPVSERDVVERLNAVATAPTNVELPPPRARKPAGRMDGAAWVKVAVMALLTAGSVGASAYYVFFRPQGEPLQVSALGGNIPVTSATRYSSVATAVLSDEAWLTRPEVERRRDLQEALSKVTPAGMDRVVLRDSSGAVRAVAISQNGQVSFLFP